MGEENSYPRLFAVRAVFRITSNPTKERKIGRECCKALCPPHYVTENLKARCSVTYTPTDLLHKISFDLKTGEKSATEIDLTYRFQTGTHVT